MMILTNLHASFLSLSLRGIKHDDIFIVLTVLHKQRIAHGSAEILKRPLDISGGLVVPWFDTDLSTNTSPTPVRPVYAV